MAAAVAAGNTKRYENLKRWLQKKEATLERVNTKLADVKANTQPTKEPTPPKEEPTPPQEPTPPNNAPDITQSGLRPAVDRSLEAAPAVGHSTAYQTT